MVVTLLFLWCCYVVVFICCDVVVVLRLLIGVHNVVFLVVFSLWWLLWLL